MEGSDILVTDGWKAGVNASITTYRNERVFMLQFSNAQPIEDTRWSQEFTLDDTSTSFNIRYISSWP
jgi:hypothetical protein